MRQSRVSYFANTEKHVASQLMHSNFLNSLFFGSIEVYLLLTPLKRLLFILLDGVDQCR